MKPEDLSKLNELYAWMLDRKRQQLSFPVDDASRAAMGALIITSGTSSTLTQVYTDTRGDQVTAPKAYAGSFFAVIEGQVREIPFL